MKRGVAVLALLLTGCGVFGTSAVGYAKKACDTIGKDSVASPADASATFNESDVDAWVSEYTRAANYAAKAANEQTRWVPLSNSMSHIADLLTTQRDALKTVIVNHNDWTTNPQLADAMRGLNADIQTIQTQCRIARA